MNDHELAEDAARRAGELLLELRAAGASRDEGDHRSNDLILDLLARERPDDAVLSEESQDSPERLSRERVWIVDPLDGTREFGEEGRTDWAVHIALWEKGDLVAGAIALPARDSTLATDAPPLVPKSDTFRIACSRTRPPEFLHRLAADLHAELVPMGSAGVKVAAVVLGDVDAYVHAGGQYEWDSAAPVAVARAAGLHVSRIDGSPVKYNQPDPKLPDLLVCRTELSTTL